jgi:hypothetical protein
VLLATNITKASTDFFTDPFGFASDFDKVDSKQIALLKSLANPKGSVKKSVEAFVILVANNTK